MGGASRERGMQLKHALARTVDFDHAAAAAAVCSTCGVDDLLEKDRQATDGVGVSFSKAVVSG